MESTFKATAGSKILHSTEDPTMQVVSSVPALHTAEWYEIPGGLGGGRARPVELHFRCLCKLGCPTAITDAKYRGKVMSVSECKSWGFAWYCTP